MSLSLDFQMGKHDEAWMILKQVHDTNMRAKGTPEKVFTVSVQVWTSEALCHCVLHGTSALLKEEYSLNISITFIPGRSLH